jgi:hypothetical protein
LSFDIDLMSMEHTVGVHPDDKTTQLLFVEFAVAAFKFMIELAGVGAKFSGYGVGGCPCRIFVEKYIWF